MDIDGQRLCCLFNQAISKQGAPNYISSDNDPLFRYHRWKANLRILDIEEVKSVPYLPISHPFVERLIGTIRRELLDHTFFWNTSDLDRKLRAFQEYYNSYRVHSSRFGQTPVESDVADKISLPTFHNYRWQFFCRGLFQLPAAT